MPTWPALLRVLLCFTLVLNGSGTAIAATRMQLAHVEHTQVDQAKTAESAMRAHAPPCHDHPGMATTEPQASPLAMAGDTRPATSKHASPDCCQSGNCSCACTQPAPFAMAWPGMPGIAVVHDRVVPAMAMGHPSPTLPQLNRPPIG